MTKHLFIEQDRLFMFTNFSFISPVPDISIISCYLNFSLRNNKLGTWYFSDDESRDNNKIQPVQCKVL